MSSNGTTFGFGLTNYLNRNQIYYLSNNGVSPFWTRVQKEEAEESSGDFVASTAVYNNPQGWSSTYGQASTNASQAGGGGNVKGVKWLSAYGFYIGSLQISDQIIKQSRDNFGAFLQNKKAEMDGFFKTYGKRMATYMLGSQGHSLTPGGFTISSGVCTCVDPRDGANIEVGQQLQVSAGAGDSNSDTLLTASIGFVIATNRNTGVFTVSATAGGSAGTPGSWTGTMFAFNALDGGSSGFTGFTRVIVGFGAWVPPSDPTSAGFETTIDRTTDVVSLSGTRLSTAAQQGLNTEQRVQKLVATMVGLNGADTPTDIYVHSLVFQDLIGTMENRGTRPLGQKIAGFNYEKIEFHTSEGAINIWSEPRMPPGAVYVVNHGYIKAWSLDGYPGKYNEDGIDFGRMPNSTDWELRSVCYPAFQVPGVGHQGRCTAA